MNEFFLSIHKSEKLGSVKFQFVFVIFNEILNEICIFKINYQKPALH